MIKQMKTDTGNMYLISARDTQYIDKHRDDKTLEKMAKGAAYNGIPFSKNLYFAKKQEDKKSNQEVNYDYNAEETHCQEDASDIMTLKSRFNKKTGTKHND